MYWLCVTSKWHGKTLKTRISHGNIINIDIFSVQKDWSSFGKTGTPYWARPMCGKAFLTWTLICDRILSGRKTEGLWVQWLIIVNFVDTAVQTICKSLCVHVKKLIAGVADSLGWRTVWWWSSKTDNGEVEKFGQLEPEAGLCNHLG